MAYSNNFSELQLKGTGFENGSILQGLHNSLNELAKSGWGQALFCDFVPLSLGIHETFTRSTGA